VGVSRKKRVAGLAFAAMFPALMVSIAVASLPAERAIRQDPLLNRLGLVLSELRLVIADSQQTTDPSVSAPQAAGYAFGRWLGSLSATPRNWSERERRAFATIVIDRYGSQLTDERIWAAFEADSAPRAREFRSAVTKARAIYGVSTPEERSGAEQAAAAVLQRIEEQAASRRPFAAAWISNLLSLLSIVLAATGFISIVLAVILRGPAGLRLLGYTIAAEIGDRVTRARIGFRGLVVWSPVFIAGFGAIALRQDAGMGEVIVAGTGLAIFLAGVAWTIWRPERGLHDRIARTWVVPR
jgi:hypothetical protein